MYVSKMQPPNRAERAISFAQQICLLIVDGDVTDGKHGRDGLFLTAITTVSSVECAGRTSVIDDRFLVTGCHLTFFSRA